MTDPDDYEKPPEEKNPLEKLRDSFRQEMEELAKLELDVEELAERRAALLRAYIRDDIHGIRTFWKDLQGEVHTLEDFVFQWLMRAANPTPVDWVKLDQYLEHGENRLMAGETATDVELVCVGCGRIRLVEGTAKVKPCSRCGAELYEVRQKRH
ncbi:zinc ribbon-containing protein [Gilvimarinus sp. F26214L]|uniref:zinc ribbon-containing protein n=1 Tax=Gilvimarinus sp. DZF01 TaxID=3461371 RepID=UPI0040467591